MERYLEMPDCQVMLAKEILNLLEYDVAYHGGDKQYTRDATEYARQLKICIEEFERHEKT